MSRHIAQMIAVAAMAMTIGLPVAAAADGWASVNGDTTGGAAGSTVTVSTAADLITYATAVNPYVIRIQGTISLSATLNVNSNKTLVGVDTSSTIDGEIMINAKSNVIIQYLNITNDRTVGTGDGVRIYASNHVWVDHCTVYDCDDGCVDNSNNTDYITISWCKFYYTRDNGHNFVNLIGASDTDTGNYRITFHHNWWSALCKQRMPRDRFGQIHMYNNYWDCTGNDYCSSVALTAQMLSESNYYNQVTSPIFKDTATGADALIRTVGNIYDSCTGLMAPGTDTVFTPPYPYTPDDTENVPPLAMANAGNVPGGDVTPPAAPTGLTAVESAGDVILDWADNAEPDLAGYNVKRSGSSGGPYVTIATGVPASTYTDTSADPDTTYYYVVRAVDTAQLQSGNSNEASATTSGAGPTRIYAVNSGGAAASPFVADAYYTGGSTYGNSNPIDTSGVTNPAPVAVYQIERHGNFVYTFPDLTPGLNYLVRLHFCEIYFTSSGSRVFDVFVNGTLVLDNYDIIAATGAKNKAIVREFTVQPNGSGQIVVQYASVTDNSLSSGIEIVNPGSGTPDTTPPSPDPMTFATAPYATGSTSIAMVATTAADASGVEYLFTCTLGGGHSSAWQTSTSYTDTGLTSNTTYTYTVTARDQSANQNQTAASAPASATTQSAPVLYNPGAYAVVLGTYSSGTIAALTANDNVYLVIASQTSGTTRYATTDFTVSGIAGSASRLDLQVISKSSRSSTTQKIYLYNYVTAVWDQKDSTTIGTAEVTRNIAVTTGAANYISGGQLKVRTEGSKTKSTSFNLSHELISVTVTP